MEKCNGSGHLKIEDFASLGFEMLLLKNCHARKLIYSLECWDFCALCNR